MGVWGLPFWGFVGDGEDWDDGDDWGHEDDGDDWGSWG